MVCELSHHHHLHLKGGEGEYTGGMGCWEGECICVVEDTIGA